MRLTILALTLNEIDGVKAILPSINRAWYDQLSGCICESAPQVSYDEFALAQHDLEEMRRDDYRRTLRQS